MDDAERDRLMALAYSTFVSARNAVDDEYTRMIFAVAFRMGFRTGRKAGKDDRDEAGGLVRSDTDRA